MSLLDKEEINGDNPHYVELAQSTGRHVLPELVLIRAAILFCKQEERKLELINPPTIKTPSGQIYLCGTSS